MANTYATQTEQILTMLDAGRKYDLEELYKLRQSAKNSYWRDLYDKRMDQILRETGDVRSLREELIMAIRNDDIRHIKYINHELTRIKARMTNGKDY